MIRFLPLLLASCASLPRIQVVGWDRGPAPRDWAPAIAYYGDGWGDFRPHLLCALDQTGPDFGAGLVIEFRRHAPCGYDPIDETITAPDFDCAKRMLPVRAVDVLEPNLQPCEEI